MSRDALIHVIISTRNTSVYFAYSRYNSIQHTTLTHAGLHAYTHPHYQYLSPNMHIFISYIYIYYYLFIYMLQIYLSLYIYIEKKSIILAMAAMSINPTFAFLLVDGETPWSRQARAFEEVIERFYQRYPNQSLGAIDILTSLLKGNILGMMVYIYTYSGMIFYYFLFSTI